MGKVQNSLTCAKAVTIVGTRTPLQDSYELGNVDAVENGAVWLGDGWNYGAPDPLEFRFYNENLNDDIH